MEIRQKRSLHKNWIDKHAYQIVEDLQKAGYKAYLVGGCVRDLLAGMQPKDFDIVTNATPQEIRKNVRNSYIIGKRFRLVLVYRYQKMFEVATFRRDPSKEELCDDDFLVKDNLFGSPKEDANRRDFTVNGIFYDCVKDEVIDFVNGIKDLEDGYLRMIGDPQIRLVEDPIRILRAIRLAHKLRLTIEPELRQAMQLHTTCLANSALPRRREEFLKILKLDDPMTTLTHCYDLDVLRVIFPQLHELWESEVCLERFHYYMSLKKQIVFEDAEAQEDMAFFLFCFFRAFDIKKSYASVLKNINESDFKNFFKNEISLFKAECEWIRKVYQLIEKLPNLDFFTMKKKTKNHLLSQKQLAIALRYIQADYLMEPEQILAWKVALGSD